jgi:BolA protein
MTAARVSLIRQRLEEALAPTELEVVDDSHRHAGHAGARDGRGHFNVRLVSSSFSGKRRVARHKLVYAALGALMQTDIHALGLIALSPEESESGREAS